jgi:hypothetical protein
VSPVQCHERLLISLVGIVCQHLATVGAQHRYFLASAGTFAVAVRHGLVRGEDVLADTHFTGN